LELTGGNTLSLAETEPAAGNIKQMRLILGDNNNIDIIGDKLVLDTPSAQQTGVQ